MRIELDPEDLKGAEALVADGRFVSVQEAIGAGIHALMIEAQDLRWSPELQERIDAGIEAAGRQDFASEDAVNSLFTRFQQKSA